MVTNIDMEMKLWEDRLNDNFGKILQKIKKLTNDIFYHEEDEFGISSTPISHEISIYCLDGNKKVTANRVESILENYDILENYSNIKKLVNKLKSL